MCRSTLFLSYDELVREIDDGVPERNSKGSLIRRLLRGMGCPSTLQEPLVEGLTTVWEELSLFGRNCLSMSRATAFDTRSLRSYVRQIAMHLQKVAAAAESLDDVLPRLFWESSSECTEGDLPAFAEEVPFARVLQERLEQALDFAGEPLREVFLHNIVSIFEDCIEVHRLLRLPDSLTSPAPEHCHGRLYDAYLSLFFHTIPNHIRDMDDDCKGALSNCQELHYLLSRGSTQS